VGGFLIILILVAVVWLLFVMPARRRRSSHEAMQDTVDVGDEIITAGGLHGHVVEMGETTVRLEIAPSVTVTLDRRAIAAVATEVEVEVEPPTIGEQDESIVEKELPPAESDAGTSAEPR
jgi:preprotein translocase subunit YajC